jgi:diguanylate cyclase (GGDEF)-like protein
LTGVYVRAFFEQQLIRELRTSFRHKNPLSLILLDLDYLKKANDIAGHLGGDQALAIMGLALRKSTRATDFVGRYGGDEFAILLPNTPLEEAYKVTDRIYEYLKGKKIEGDFGSIPIQCSMGVCGMEVQEFKHGSISYPIPQSYINEMVKLFINEADKMLYKAKKNGRSCAVTGENIKWLPFTVKP